MPITRARRISVGSEEGGFGFQRARGLEVQDAEVLLEGRQAGDVAPRGVEGAAASVEEHVVVAAHLLHHDERHAHPPGLRREQLAPVRVLALVEGRGGDGHGEVDAPHRARSAGGSAS